MHERTERAIARLLFVFCCAIPTAAIMLAILVSWTPWYHNRQRRALEQFLSRDLGLVVTIESFERVSPMAWSLKQVHVVEPETKQTVLHVQRVTWLNESDRIGISLHQPKLNAPMLRHAWRLTHDRFLCRPEVTRIPIEVAANNLSIDGQAGPFELQDVLATIMPRPNSVKATLQCIPAISPDSEVRIDITRDRGGEQPTTHWAMETEGTPLPCSVLAGCLPEIKVLGPEAKFQGQLKWELMLSGDWSVELGNSQFIDIELGELFDRLPHRFTGSANVHLNRCSVVPRKSINIAGSLSARNGYIGPSLLRSANRQLGFAVDAEAARIDASDVRYDLVSFDFNLLDQNLFLQGTCGRVGGYNLPPGSVAIGMQRVLAKSSDAEMPVVQLAHAIAAEDSEVVPITPETSGILHLFVPPASVLPIDQAD